MPTLREIQCRLRAGRIDPAEAARLLSELPKRGRPKKTIHQIVDKRQKAYKIGRDYQALLDAQVGAGRRAISQRDCRWEICHKWKISDSLADKYLRTWRAWVVEMIWSNNINPFDPLFPSEWVGVLRWMIEKMEQRGVFERHRKIMKTQ